jgi:hypothetical protein
MNSDENGLKWSAFAAEATSLADDIARLIGRFRFAFLGTIRRDGSPRISPVETHLVEGRLLMVMIPRTRKAQDVRRDNRVALQSPISDPANPGPEYKLRGRATSVTSQDERVAIATSVRETSGWRPRPDWLFVSILLSDATHTRWNRDGTAVMTRWRMDRPSVETRRLALDMEFGGYRTN